MVEDWYTGGLVLGNRAFKRERTSVADNIRNTEDEGVFFPIAWEDRMVPDEGVRMEALLNRWSMLSTCLRTVGRGMEKWCLASSQSRVSQEQHGMTRQTHIDRNTANT